MNDPQNGNAASVLSNAYRFLDSFQRLSGDPTMGIQQVTMLLALYVHGELNQLDLPRYSHVEKSSVSRNIAKLGMGVHPLEKAGPGWVESFEDLQDRRLKIVRLTAAGYAMLSKVANAAINGSGSSA